jgi:lysozyme family protein
MTDFDKAFEHVIGIEGGYVNDPKDPGGETKYGISKRSYPAEDIKNLNIERAKIIYRMDYWNKIKGDELPYPLNMFVFDAAVNQGVDPAIDMLQKTLGVTRDGLLGAATIKAAQDARGQAMTMYLADRALRYTGTRNFDQYGRGWLRRLFVLAMEV